MQVFFHKKDTDSSDGDGGEKKELGWRERRSQNEETDDSEVAVQTQIKRKIQRKIQRQIQIQIQRQIQMPIQRPERRSQNDDTDDSEEAGKKAM